MLTNKTRGIDIEIWTTRLDAKGKITRKKEKKLVKQKTKESETNTDEIKAKKEFAPKSRAD